MRRPYDFETISEVDVVRELARFINSSVSDENGNNGALRFASELTGMSEDLLLELIDDEYYDGYDDEECNFC